MKIGIFATDEVGLEVVTFVRGSGQRLACLALDERDAKGLNERIRSAAGRTEILSNRDLQSAAGVAGLEALGLDWIILAWWPYLVKEPVLGIPRLGCLNLHNSFLPHCRGKNPNFWAIVDEAPYGASIHFADSGIDTGDVAFQSAIPASWEDTGQSLYQRGKQELVDLFKRYFPQILSGEVPRTKQTLDLGRQHKAGEMEAACRIELDRAYSARYLLNLIRARTFPPHPAVGFEDGGRMYEVRIEIKRVNHG